jgi:hypothetical protein
MTENTTDNEQDRSRKDQQIDKAFEELIDDNTESFLLVTAREDRGVSTVTFDQRWDAPESGMESDMQGMLSFAIADYSRKVNMPPEIVIDALLQSIQSRLGRSDISIDRRSFRSGGDTE